MIPEHYISARTADQASHKQEQSRMVQSYHLSTSRKTSSKNHTMAEPTAQAAPSSPRCPGTSKSSTKCTISIHLLTLSLPGLQRVFLSHEQTLSSNAPQPLSLQPFKLASNCIKCEETSSGERNSTPKPLFTWQAKFLLSICKGVADSSYPR